MNIGGLVENSFVDYPTKICCTIFTIGCNMNCWYCHNKHLLNKKVKIITEQEVFSFLSSHKPFLDAVTISGGEPTLQSDLPIFIKKIKDMGYLVKLDTNGTNFLMLKDLIDNKLLDYVAMDIKAPLNKYNFITSNFDKIEIKKSIELLKQNKVNYEFRTTLSPNLSSEDIIEIAKGLKGVKNYSLQQYNKPTNNECDNEYISNFKLKSFTETEAEQLKLEANKYVKNVIIKGF